MKTAWTAAVIASLLGCWIGYSTAKDDYKTLIITLQERNAELTAFSEAVGKKLLFSSRPPTPRRCKDPRLDALMSTAMKYSDTLPPVFVKRWRVVVTAVVPMDTAQGLGEATMVLCDRTSATPAQ